MDGKYYIKAEVESGLRAEFTKWTETHGPSSARISCNHFTLIYDIGTENRAEIESLLRGKEISATLGVMRIGDVSPVLFVELESPELHELFQQIYALTHQSAQVLIDGKYTPHITLFWFDDRAQVELLVAQNNDIWRGKRITFSNWTIAESRHRS